MRKRILYNVLFILFGQVSAHAQETLPNISVNNLNGKIIISWLNEYKKPIANIFIQRSYDSLRNFRTIGSVLNPSNLENGFPDNHPPYLKMYYRVLVTFEGGSYEMGTSKKPFRETPPLPPFVMIQEPEYIPAKPLDTIQIKKEVAKDSVLLPKEPIAQAIVDSLKRISIQQEKINRSIPTLNHLADSLLLTRPKSIVETAYPSSRVFTSKQNTLVISIPSAIIKRYQVKFYTEENEFLFEITKMKEDILMIDKENFVKSGWFYFEIYEDGKLIEKSKFFIPKYTKGNK
jgi:hypothetical protein